MAHSEKTESSGERLYLIRLACGDGLRTPETLEKFAERIERETKAVYSSMTLSLLERMKQKWRIEDADRLSRVDPLRRGAVWLSALDRDETSEAVPAAKSPTVIRTGAAEKFTRIETGRAVKKRKAK